MADLVVVCGGREVDGQLRPRGEPCGNRWRPPGLVPPVPGYVVFSPLAPELRPPTVDEVVQRAEAADWAVAPRDWPDHTEAELVGTCPQCRRPAPEAVALVREVKRRGR